MVFVFLSICCNVTVSVLLKLARRYEINVSQAVVWNYAVAALLTLILYRPVFAIADFDKSPYGIYILLAVLLPSLFIVLGKSVRATGIVRTDLAQRLSLFIPLAVSFLLFAEELSVTRLAGIIVGFVAIFCSIPWQKGKSSNSKTAVWVFPLTVFLGMGLIDILFKQIASNTQINYTSSLFIVFVLAFAVSIIVFTIAIILGKTKFNWYNFVCGLILGLFNFGNILFYLKAHRALPDNPSVVFTAMNIGVIVAGSLIGVILFKERLSLVNKIGIALAIISILVISY